MADFDFVNVGSAATGISESIDGTVYIAGQTPEIYLYETGAATNNKSWKMSQSANVIHLCRLQNDDLSNGTSIINFFRNGPLATNANFSLDDASNGGYYHRFTGPIAVGKDVRRLDYEETGTNPRLSEYLGKVWTTNGTATMIYEWDFGAAPLTDNAYLIKAEVVGHRTGGSGSAGDSYAYVRHCLVKSITGTPTIVGQNSVSTFESNAGGDASFSVSGSKVQFKVTGIASTNIAWNLYATGSPAGT